jgi:hypothetical protein
MHSLARNSTRWQAQWINHASRVSQADANHGFNADISRGMSNLRRPGLPPDADFFASSFVRPSIAGSGVMRAQMLLSATDRFDAPSRRQVCSLAKTSRTLPRARERWPRYGAMAERAVDAESPPPFPARSCEWDSVVDIRMAVVRPNLVALGVCQTIRKKPGHVRSLMTA